jgi:hypothetical protein
LRVFRSYGCNGVTGDAEIGAVAVMGTCPGSSMGVTDRPSRGLPPGLPGIVAGR